MKLKKFWPVSESANYMHITFILKSLLQNQFENSKRAEYVIEALSFKCKKDCFAK